MSIPHSLYVSQTNSADGNSPYQDGVAASATNTYYSRMQSQRNSNGTNIQVLTTGTLTGTFTVWVSDKPNPNEANDNDWVNTAIAPTSPAGAATNQVISVPATFQSAFRVRLKYINASGTGNLFAYAVTVKGA